MAVAERPLKEELQMVRCRSCRQPLPIRVRLTDGSIIVAYCRHCKRETVVLGAADPHWAR